MKYLLFILIVFTTTKSFSQNSDEIIDHFISNERNGNLSNLDSILNKEGFKKDKTNEKITLSKFGKYNSTELKMMNVYTFEENGKQSYRIIFISGTSDEVENIYSKILSSFKKKFGNHKDSTSNSKSWFFNDNLYKIGFTSIFGNGAMSIDVRSNNQK